MSPRLTLPGCLQLAVGVAVFGLICFGLGLVLQIGLGAVSALVASPPPPPLPTLAPTAPPPPSPTATLEPTATPEPTVTPEPTATLEPTPTPEPTVTPPPPVVRYTVQQGDTLFDIAQRFGVTVAAIIEANPGLDPDLLRVGQEIVIPNQ